MGRTYYYVDSENVHNNLDALLRAIKRYDRVVWCYSVASPTIKCEYLEEFARKRVRVIYLNCQVGSPNAMDFQIVMQMAHDYATGAADAVRVYSNDHGFIIPIKAWADKGFNFGVLHPDILMPVPQQSVKKTSSAQIVVLENTESAVIESTQAKVPTTPDFVLPKRGENSLRDDIANRVDEKDVERVYLALRQCKGTKNKFHTQLQSAYPGEPERASILYHSTKIFISRWNEAKVEFQEIVTIGSTLYDDILNIVGKDKAGSVYRLIKESGGSISNYNSAMFKHFRPAIYDRTVSDLVIATKHLVARWKEK